jgi:hypothetical protein
MENSFPNSEKVNELRSNLFTPFTSFPHLTLRNFLPILNRPWVAAFNFFLCNFKLKIAFCFITMVSILMAKVDLPFVGVRKVIMYSGLYLRNKI